MTQFTKHPVLYRFEIIPAFRMSLLSNVRLAIFEMHVQDTFAETFETVKDDLAIDAARAVEIMTRIEHKPEQVRVGHIKEMGDCFWRLDVTTAMMMKSHRESGFVTYSASNAFGTPGECFAFGWTQTHFKCDAASILCAQRVGAVGIGKDEQR